MRKYNYHPDLPDHRDLHYGVQALKAVSDTFALPQKVDLRPLCSPVENQGDIGSCSGHAIAGALEYLENKDKLPFHKVSRLFVYYNERCLEGTAAQDAGATLRDGIKSLVKFGACDEALWAYDQSLLFQKPTDAAYQDAANHKITQYLRVDNLGELKHALAQGIPVVMGIAVYESFESPAVAQTGEVPMPGPNESLLGGHAVLAVGYDDTIQKLIVRNSWGPSWSPMQGYFHLPYDYISCGELAADLWAIQR